MTSSARLALAVVAVLAAAAAPSAARGGAQPRTLTWPAVPGAQGYELQIAVDPGFRSVVSRAATRRPAFPWSASASPVLRYRVRAVRRDGSYSPWSAPRLVATGALAARGADDFPLAEAPAATAPGTRGRRPAAPPGPEAGPLPSAAPPAPVVTGAGLPDVQPRLGPGPLPRVELAAALAMPPRRAAAPSPPLAARRAIGPALELGLAAGWRGRLRGDGAPALALHAAAWPAALGGRLGLRVQGDGFALALGPTPVNDLAAAARFAGLALLVGPAVRERAGRLRLEAGALAGVQLGRSDVAGVADAAASPTGALYGGAGLALGRAEVILEVQLSAGAWRSAHAEVPLAGLAAVLGLRWGLR